MTDAGAPLRFCCAAVAQPLFLTAAELAAEADCTTDRIEELARAGILPGLKWGRSWRFVRADAPRFLAAIAAEQAEARRNRKHAASDPARRPRRAVPPALPAVRGVQRRS